MEISELISQVLALDEKATPPYDCNECGFTRCEKHQAIVRDYREFVFQHAPELARACQKLLEENRKLREALAAIKNGTENWNGQMVGDLFTAEDFGFPVSDKIWPEEAMRIANAKLAPLGIPEKLKRLKELEKMLGISSILIKLKRLEEIQTILNHLEISHDCPCCENNRHVIEDVQKEIGNTSHDSRSCKGDCGHDHLLREFNE